MAFASVGWDFHANGKHEIRCAWLALKAKEFNILVTGHDNGIGFEKLADAEAFIELSEFPFMPVIREGGHRLQSKWRVCAP